MNELYQLCKNCNQPKGVHFWKFCYPNCPLYCQIGNVGVDVFEPIGATSQISLDEHNKMEHNGLCKNCKQPYFYHAKYKTYALCNLDGNTPNTKLSFYEPMPANPTSKDDEEKKPSLDNIFNALEANINIGWTAKNIMWLATATICWFQEWFVRLEKKGK